MQKSLKNKIIKIASITLAVILVCIGGFFIYVSDYYRADESAQEVARAEYVTNTAEGDYVISKSENAKIGCIFYPGAKVETKAYLPLMDELARVNIDCFLIDMPFHLAFFDVNAADRIIQANSQIEKWYIAGHSLGGAMASQYAYEHQDTISGLILLGAYPYKEYPLDKTLTIYGELDTSVEDKIDYTQNVYVIKGGNHAQFGNYGKQSGDADAKINAKAQQIQAVAYMHTFILFGDWSI